ncbi:MAG: hypothetical protein IIC60_14755 [Proteobacteria bacterium]|nr:hypothetical protein [Pseudomonadota bacterium]
MKLLLTTLLLLLGNGLHAQVTDVDADKWRGDLRVLVQQLSDRHISLYHSVAEASFKMTVADLYQKIPSLNRSQILVEMASRLFPLAFNFIE